jgi:5-methyltetrahydropteroyltriglutamate--homocysteine methyltransferase
MHHALPRADQVGSHLRPARLHEARARFKAGGINAAELRAVEDACIRDLVRRQEEIGFQIVTDGEFRRENWWIDFIRDIGGVEIKQGTGASFTKAGDHDYKYVPLNVYTGAKISRPKPIATPDYAMLAAATSRMAKTTIPSPSRMHFHGGNAGVSNTVYPDIEQFFADVAALYRAEIADLEAAGCRLIQIDDPLLSYFISEHMQAEIIASGDKPEARLARYLALINDCIRDRRPETTIGIHVCRGNSRSGWMAEGGYERIADAVFSTLKVDRWYLEYDDARSGDFHPLRFIPKTPSVVLGLVTTKFPQMEHKDDLKRRIDDAAKYVDMDRLALSPQCGFASSVEGNIITEDVQWAKLKLVVDTAREVWGNS